MEDFVIEIEKQISRIGREIQGAVDKLTQVDSTVEGFSPKADVINLGESLEIYLDLPGLGKGDVKIKSNAGILSVEGKREAAAEGEFIKKERLQGAFARSFIIPEDAEHSGIKAKFSNGVLHVSIPRNAANNKEEIEIE